LSSSPVNGAGLTGGGISITITNSGYCINSALKDFYVTSNGGGIRRKSPVCTGVKLTNLIFDCGNTKNHGIACGYSQ
jgi:hypothetical protein